MHCCLNEKDAVETDVCNLFANTAGGYKQVETVSVISLIDSVILH